MVPAESSVSFSDDPIQPLSTLATIMKAFSAVNFCFLNKNKMTDGCVPQLHLHRPLHQFTETRWRRPFTHSDNVG